MKMWGCKRAEGMEVWGVQVAEGRIEGLKCGVWVEGIWVWRVWDTGHGRFVLHGGWWGMGRTYMQGSQRRRVGVRVEGHGR